jgi:hypothetical protein
LAKGGAPGPLLFDSGAQETIFTAEAARKLQIKVGPAQPTKVAVMICDPPRAPLLKPAGQHTMGFGGGRFWTSSRSSRSRWIIAAGG